MSNQSRNKRARYDARVEYRAVQPEVEQMLDQGYSVMAIYEKVSQSGQVTSSYTTFCEYVRGGGRRLRKGERQGKNQKRATALSQRQQPRPRGGPSAARSDAADGPFVFDKDIDLAELV